VRGTSKAFKTAPRLPDIIWRSGPILLRGGSQCSWARWAIRMRFSALNEPNALSHPSGACKRFQLCGVMFRSHRA